MLIDLPAVDTVGQNGSVIHFAQGLVDIGTVVNHNSFVGIALECPLVLGLQEFVLGGDEVAGIVVGRGDDVRPFAQGEVVPMCILKIGRSGEWQLERCFYGDDISFAFLERDGLTNGVEGVGHALEGIGHHSDGLPGAAAYGLLLQQSVVHINDAIGDQHLVAKVFIQDLLRLSGVEVRSLGHGHLVASVVVHPGVQADAFLRAGGHVEDVTLRGHEIGILGVHSGVAHVNGVELLGTQHTVAPVVAIGGGVAMHELLVCHTVEVHLPIADDESELSLGSAQRRIDGVGEETVLRAVVATGCGNRIGLVGLRTEGAVGRQVILQFDAIGLDEFSKAACPDLSQPFGTIHIGMQEEGTAVARLGSEQRLVVLEEIPYFTVAGIDAVVGGCQLIDDGIVAVKAVHALLKIAGSVVGVGAIPDGIIDEDLAGGETLQQLLDDLFHVLAIGVGGDGSSLRAADSTVVGAQHD